MIYVSIYANVYIVHRNIPISVCKVRNIIMLNYTINVQCTTYNTNTICMVHTMNELHTRTT